MQHTFENQLFEYILYCTEININLLPNTCNFHREFRFIFMLILSENASNRQMCILEKLNFKISRGSMPPDPRNVIVSSAPHPIFAGPTIGDSQYNITYLNHTHTKKIFFHKKSMHLPYYTDIYFKDCWHKPGGRPYIRMIGMTVVFFRGWNRRFGIF